MAQLRCVIAAAAFVSTLGFKAPAQTLIALGLLLIQHMVGFAVLMPVVSVLFVILMLVDYSTTDWLLLPVYVLPVAFLLLYVGGHYVFFHIFAHDLAYAMRGSRADWVSQSPPEEQA
jgi:hypothetical protein